MTEQQQYPTREQIAETIAEYWADNDTDGSGVDDIIVDELARKIHESFALFPQPTPSAEPTVQVPVSLLQDLAMNARSFDMRHGDAADAAEALLTPEVD